MSDKASVQDETLDRGASKPVVQPVPGAGEESRDQLQPYLIAQLNALASRLTQMGEYDAVDLIDTVVARVTAMPQRELLADALEALARIHSELDDYVTDNDGEVGVSIAIAFEVARAAADKIRAALTQEQQT